MFEPFLATHEKGSKPPRRALPKSGRDKLMRQHRSNDDTPRCPEKNAGEYIFLGGSLFGTGDKWNSRNRDRTQDPKKTSQQQQEPQWQGGNRVIMRSSVLVGVTGGSAVCISVIKCPLATDERTKRRSLKIRPFVAGEEILIVGCLPWWKGNIFFLYFFAGLCNILHPAKAMHNFDFYAFLLLRFRSLDDALGSRSRKICSFMEETAAACARSKKKVVTEEGEKECCCFCRPRRHLRYRGAKKNRRVKIRACSDLNSNFKLFFAPSHLTKGGSRRIAMMGTQIFLAVTVLSVL